MKFLKWLVLAIFSLSLLIAVAAFAIVYIYEKEVKQYLVTQFNKQISTKVAIEDIQFSVLRNFPDASITFIHVVADGAYVGPDSSMSNPKLLKAASVSFAFNIEDIFRKEYRIKRIIVSDGELNMRVDSCGDDNFHFWKAQKDTTSSNFRFQLNRVLLQNIVFSFKAEKEAQDMKALVKQLVFSGDFSNNAYTLQAETQFTALHTRWAGGHLPENKAVSASVTLQVNKNQYSISDGSLQFADLAFHLGGELRKMPYYTDLQVFVNADNINIGSALSLLPDSLQHYRQEYEGEGILNVKSTIQGKLGIDYTPAIKLDIVVNKAKLKAIAQHLELADISFSANYSNSAQNKIGTNRLLVKSFKATFEGKPIIASFMVDNLIDPTITLKAQADIDLAKWRAFTQSTLIEKASGSAHIHIAYYGKIMQKDFKNYIQQETDKGKHYNLSGEIWLKNVSLLLKGQKQELQHMTGNIILIDNKLVFNNFALLLNGNDFNINGTTENLVDNYFDKYVRVKVALAINSNHLNAENLSAFNNTTSASSTSALSYNFSGYFALNIGQLTYAKFSATHVLGTIAFDGDEWKTNNLSFNAMSGHVDVKGSVDMTYKKDTAIIILNARLKQINIKQLFAQLNNFGQIVLTDKNLEGTLTSDIDLAAPCDKHFNINPSNFYANCSLTIENGHLHDFQPVLALSRFVKLADLKDIHFSTLHNQLEIKNRNIVIPEMEIKSNALNLTASGIHHFDNTVDYKLTLLLNDLLGRKLKERNSEFGEIETDWKTGHTMVFLTMSGPINNPKFKYDKRSVVKKIMSNIKKEKESLKAILHKEFGWFKKDTLKVAPAADELDFEHEHPAGKAKSTTNSTNSKPVKKSLFQKVKDRLKEKDESQ
jgi:hypothetical protein